jgi:hypothetical protein
LRRSPRPADGLAGFAATLGGPAGLNDEQRIGHPVRWARAPRGIPMQKRLAVSSTTTRNIEQVDHG